MNAQTETMPRRRVFAFIAMAVGMFMAILDIQIVSSSLKEIQAGLAAGASEISWVQTSYLIAEVVMIPLSGFLSRALSTRYLFAIAAGGFTLTSALCATATSIDQMMIYRALQGFIGGAMIPSVFAAAFTIFPPQQRAGVTAIVGLIATMAPTIGPTAGGYLTNMMSWHWLFLINVVPGVAVTVAAYVLIDYDKPDLKLLRKFDYVGLVTLAAFLGGLEYALEEGPQYDWLADDTIRNMVIVSAVGGALFFWRAFTAEEPVVDLKTFRDRNFATGSLFSFVTGVGLYGLVYLYPVFLARVRGYDSLQIGETMFVTGVFQMMTAPFAGRLAQRFDARLIVAIGMGLFGLSCLELVPITKDWAFVELFIPQAMRGVALMLMIVPISMLAMGTLPPSLIKNGAGLFNLTRNLGGAVGLALITTLLNARTDLHITRLHEAVSWGREAAVERLQGLTQALAPSLGSDSELTAIKIMTQSAHRESLVMAFSDVFLALAVVFMAMVLLVPLIRKPAPRGAPAGGH